MSSELEGHAALQNWRIVAYGAVLTTAVLAAAVFVWVTTPAVSPAEQCSKACVGKMKVFTESVKEHWAPKKEDVEFLGMKGQTEKQVWVETVPERCDCQ
jgi:hypothetical protein